MTEKTKGKKGIMPIHEIFGPTIQGEGMVVGRKTMFVRTGGCDYSCDWCDSAFTWNGEEKATPMTAKEVFEELISDKNRVNGMLNFDHVTISGGNPALIRQPMSDLVDYLHKFGINVGLETQGSFWRDWFTKIDDLTISPKPPSSLMKTNFKALDGIIEELEANSVNVTLKVVIFDMEDMAYAKYVHAKYPNIPFFLSVGNRDAHEEGDISQRLLKQLDWLWDRVLEDPELNDVKPLPQLHTLVYANRRKV